LRDGAAHSHQSSPPFFERGDENVREAEKIVSADKGKALVEEDVDDDSGS
jgi:hypothetical protein